MSSVVNKCAQIKRFTTSPIDVPSAAICADGVMDADTSRQSTEAILDVLRR